ncbi:MAG: hypothetical protein ACJ786_14565 [Catenulispora sp.]
MSRTRHPAAAACRTRWYRIPNAATASSATADSTAAPSPTRAAIPTGQFHACCRSRTVAQTPPTTGPASRRDRAERRPGLAATKAAMTVAGAPNSATVARAACCASRPRRW